MDIIHKSTVNFDEENKFSIDLTTNNQIEKMFFKGNDEWIVCGLDLKTIRANRRAKRIRSP